MATESHRLDIKPTIIVLAFSVALSAGLVVANATPAGEFLATGELTRLETSDGNGPRQLRSPAAGGGARTLGEPSNPADSDPGEAAEAAASVSTTIATSAGVSVPAPRTPTLAPPTTSPQIASGPLGTTTTTSAPQVTTTRRTQPRSPTTTRAPSAATTTTPATTTTTTPPPPPVNGRYSVAQVIDGTIGAGDGSNPNEESPMGRHDAPLYLPQAWNWAQGPTRNGQWGQLGTGGSRYAEFRCAVIPENGHRPPVDFRINVRSGAYYQFVNGSWNKAFDVSLTSTSNGAYMGQAGVVNSDPFNAGRGAIQWRQEPDGSFSAPWNRDALMMHFWAGRRQAPASGQTAEFLTSEVRLMQPDGGNVDLSKVQVLFQCGIDYYNTTGGQGTKVPGPGISKYHRATGTWRPSLWVTLPPNTPAASVGDFRNWLEANLPPDVRP